MVVHVILLIKGVKKENHIEYDSIFIFRKHKGKRKPYTIVFTKTRVKDMVGYTLKYYWKLWEREDKL